MAFEVFGLSVYVWIALISILFLIVLAVLGGYGFDTDADVDGGLDYGEFSGPGISPLSLPIVAAFGASFGSLGALFDRAGIETLFVPVLAAFGAIGISAALFFGVQKYLVRAQASSDVLPTALLGHDAQVTVPIRRSSQGQILVITDVRGRTLFPAKSSEEIARDEIVEIIGFAGGVADVRKKTT